jgi:hypothetical protein
MDGILPVQVSTATIIVPKLYTLYGAAFVLLVLHKTVTY